MANPSSRLEDLLRLVTYGAEFVAAVVAIFAVCIAINNYEDATEHNRKNLEAQNENLQAQTAADATNILQEHLSRHAASPVGFSTNRGPDNRGKVQNPRGGAAGQEEL